MHDALLQVIAQARLELRIIRAQLGELGVARVPAVRRPREKIEGLLFGKRVLEGRRVRDFEWDRALHIGPKVQESVAEREIEQAIAPLLEPCADGIRWTRSYGRRWLLERHLRGLDKQGSGFLGNATRGGRSGRLGRGDARDVAEGERPIAIHAGDSDVDGEDEILIP